MLVALIVRHIKICFLHLNHFSVDIALVKAASHIQLLCIWNDLSQIFKRKVFFFFYPLWLQPFIPIKGYAAPLWLKYSRTSCADGFECFEKTSCFTRWISVNTNWLSWPDMSINNFRGKCQLIMALSLLLSNALSLSLSPWSWQNIPIKEGCAAPLSLKYSLIMSW